MKLWKMPVVVGTLSLIGLLSAIMGTGGWHIVSWIALTIPVYYMFKYGVQFLSNNTHRFKLQTPSHPDS